MITTLDKTRVDAKVMKKAIKTLNQKFEGAQKSTSDLLKKLTLKATTLEKLKAKVGLSKSLDAYLQLTEMDVEEEEEDELLKEGELMKIQCHLKGSFIVCLKLIFKLTVYVLINFYCS